MKQKIVYIVLGAALVVIIGLGYDLYSLNKTVSTDTAVLGQIVSLINSSNQKSAMTSAPVK